MSSFEVGSIVEGVVTSITHFGAFVELPGGKTGLVHISEVADSYVRDVKDFIKERDLIKVKVLQIDEKGKIGLSIRQANPGAARPKPRQKPSISFEDRLAKFLKDSDERQSQLRRMTDAKRGGRGAR